MLSIYKASAGSGKTYTLAYEYIRLLLGMRDPDTGVTRLYKGGDRHRSILAITFTNKATDEMKRRIIHELAVLAGMEPGWTKKSPYLKDLTNYYNAAPEKIATAAKEALLHLLFDFNYFQVSTIDAFFQMILRTFAREAELTGNYDLELDSKYAVKMGVDQLLNSVNHDADTKESRRVVKWISDYLLREMDEGHFNNLFDRSNNFYHVFVKFIDDISDETFALNYDRIMEYLSDPGKLTRFQAGLYSAIEKKREATMALCQATLQAHANSAYALPLDRWLIPALKKWVENRGHVPATSTVEKVAKDITKAYTAASLKKRDAGEYDAPLEAMISQTCRAVYDFDTNSAIMRETARNLFVLGLLESVYRYISEYRADNNTILLSDTNALLHDIIGEDDTPFVYERVGVWFHNFLIDEFQDTSGLQWENLRPLLAQGLAYGHDSLIIGDEKQCIYRFRDSDPTLLGHQVGTTFRHDLAPERDAKKANTNWRSSADVVRFNNTLFERIAHMTGFGPIYANVVQNIADKRVDHKGYVKVEQIVLEGRNDENEIEGPLKILGDDIERQLAAGYSPGRIAILTRWRKEATLCIEYLERRMKEGEGFCRPFRIISDDALLLSSSPAVRLIVSVLRFTENIELKKADKSVVGQSDEADEAEKQKSEAIKGAAARLTNRFEYISSRGVDPSQALAEALRQLEEERAAEKISPDTIADDDTSDDMTTVGEVNAETSHSEASQDIKEMLEDTMAGLSGQASLSALVDEIITGYLSPEMCEDENMYISAFQDIVLDYSQRGGNDLHGFLMWWDSNAQKLTVSAPEENDAIRVMTVHKSKGLEFGCVHIPFANWALTSSKGYEWFVPAGLDSLGIAPEDIPPLLPFKPAGMDGTAYEPQFKKLQQAQRLDELNVMYVAFTRAVDELCVTFTVNKGSSDKSSKSSATSKRKSSVSTDISDTPVAYKTTGELLEALANEAQPLDSGWRYEAGTPTMPREEEEDPRTALDPEGQYAMRPYDSHPRRDLWEDTRLDTLPDLMEGRPRERGLMLHDVMSQIKKGSDIHPVIMKLVRQSRIPASEASEIEQYISDAIASVADMGWFEGYRRIVNEREIVPVRGKIRRPDRIVWTAAGTVDVIDYKFGEERPTQYSDQIRRYIYLLRQLGFRNVRGFIWYIDRNKLVRV